VKRRKANGPAAEPAALAAIERQVHVRLVNVSRGGCMFESDHPLDEGTVGTLTVHVASMGTFEDVVRVVRSVEVAGGGARYRVGVTFQWTTAPGERSLRQLGHRLPAAAERPVGIVSVVGGFGA
jgi:hypothetical protein